MSMGFSRQEYWGGVPFPSPGVLPTWGLNPSPLHFQKWRVGSLPPVLTGMPVSFLFLLLLLFNSFCLIWRHYVDLFLTLFLTFSFYLFIKFFFWLEVCQFFWNSSSRLMSSVHFLFFQGISLFFFGHTSRHVVVLVP